MITATVQNSVHDFYRDTLEILEDAGVSALVGGAFAQEYFTGISRNTKDLDLFIQESDLRRTLDALSERGYRTEVTFSHWLGKAFDYDGKQFVDIIFNSGNGLCKVDDTWFANAPDGRVFDRAVKFCPVEESIWQKAFIMERERYDGADIAHLLRAQGDMLDWRRLLRRFDGHWRVLMSYITLFGYIYPTERSKIPDWVQRKLAELFSREIARNAPGEPACAGTFLSRAQYTVDVDEWGYRDMRTPDHMTPEAVQRWTAAAQEEKKS
jgi:putative nucleotidyltransferase-like protein